jgi:hypothetical protein
MPILVLEQQGARPIGFLDLDSARTKIGEFVFYLG